MNKINPNKYIDIINKNKDKDKEKSSNNKFKLYLTNLVIRTLIVLVIFVSMIIIFKDESVLKDKISNFYFKKYI